MRICSPICAGTRKNGIGGVFAGNQERASLPSSCTASSILISMPTLSTGATSGILAREFRDWIFPHTDAQRELYGSPHCLLERRRNRVRTPPKFGERPRKRRSFSSHLSPLITQLLYTKGFANTLITDHAMFLRAHTNREKCKPTLNGIDTFNTLRRSYDVRTCSDSRRATGLCTVDGWMCRWILPSLSLIEILDPAMLPTIACFKLHILLRLYC